VSAGCLPDSWGNFKKEKDFCFAKQKWIFMSHYIVGPALRIVVRGGGGVRGVFRPVTFI
jgi:hypothetical protein